MILRSQLRPYAGARCNKNICRPKGTRAKGLALALAARAVGLGLVFMKLTASISLREPRVSVYSNEIFLHSGSCVGDRA